MTRPVVTSQFYVFHFYFFKVMTLSIPMNPTWHLVYIVAKSKRCDNYNFLREKNYPLGLVTNISPFKGPLLRQWFSSMDPINSGICFLVPRRRRKLPSPSWRNHWNLKSECLFSGGGFRWFRVLKGYPLLQQQCTFHFWWFRGIKESINSSIYPHFVILNSVKLKKAKSCERCRNLYLSVFSQNSIPFEMRIQTTKKQTPINPIGILAHRNWEWFHGT